MNRARVARDRRHIHRHARGDDVGDLHLTASKFMYPISNMLVLARHSVKSAYMRVLVTNLDESDALGWLADGVSCVRLDMR